MKKIAILTFALVLGICNKVVAQDAATLLQRANQQYAFYESEYDRRIRDLREDHDLTQKQVAQLLGMSQTGYSKYETGENDIPTTVLIKLADFYKTSTDYLLGRTDKK